MEPKLTPAEHARVRRLASRAEAPEPGGGELNVVPFLDIIINVMMFVLASLPAIFTATIDARMPGAHPHPSEARSLGLTVVVSRDGLTLKTREASLDARCEAGSGLTVPGRDFAGLTACAAKVKASDPAWANETEVRVVAEPGTDLQTIVETLGALREGPSGEVLFPDPLFATAL